MAQLAEHRSLAEWTSISSVNVYISIPLDVLTSAVKISSQAKERKKKKTINVSVESKAS